MSCLAREDSIHDLPGRKGAFLRAEMVARSSQFYLCLGETTTRVPRAAERTANPRETGAQTEISETTLNACILQFLAVYVPVLLIEYLLLYIGELGH
jgi:hypothetical protein